jgi:C-terminal processing protease CtpA/Prc
MSKKKKNYYYSTSHPRRYAGGVKVNDVIVDVDSRQTNDLAEFRDAIVQSGGLIHLAVKRAGTVVTLRCTRKNFRG